MPWQDDTDIQTKQETETAIYRPIEKQDEDEKDEEDEQMIHFQINWKCNEARWFMIWDDSTTVKLTNIHAHTIMYQYSCTVMK